jgi:hypothetical protein
MPHLDAAALETDPDGAALLRSVLDTGRRGSDAAIDEGESFTFGRRLTIEIEREIDTVPIGVLVAASA